MSLSEATEHNDLALVGIALAGWCALATPASAQVEAAVLRQLVTVTQESGKAGSWPAETAWTCSAIS